MKYYIVKLVSIFMDRNAWLDDVKIPESQPPLRGNIKADVAVIGGGLAGYLTAYLLAKAGKKIAILEKKDITNTVTAYTTAWLTAVIDTDLVKLIKMYRSDGARKIWQSGMDAIDLVEKIAEEEKIDCDFMRVPHYRFATKEPEMLSLKKEQATANSLGFATVLHGPEFLNFANYGSLELRSQAKFHSIKFLIGLRQVCLQLGVEIYEDTEVKEIRNLSKDKVEVHTLYGELKSQYAVVTTYEPFHKPRELFAHIGTYISYVLEIYLKEDILPEALYEDEQNPYHYFRVDYLPEGVRIILGGEDHRKELKISAEKNFKALEAYFKKLFPGVEYKIKNKWDGPILETVDGLPYIGRYSKKCLNVLVATGFSGNGMTYSAISGMILSDIVLKNRNPYEKIYSAERKTRLFNFLEKFVDFSGEFFGGAVKNTLRKL